MTEQTRFDGLVLRYEELRAQGTIVSAKELCQDCPELLTQLERQIRDLESMNRLLGGAASEDASAATEPDPAGAGLAARPAEALSTGSRYQILRFHAKGGLGEVHVAQDQELHRKVALKRLRSLHARNPQSRDRFLREAEITSRLEHPSIVPVHSVGQDADGRPFYAMRFIQGDTLEDAIKQFHGAASGGDGKKSASEIIIGALTGPPARPLSVGASPTINDGLSGGAPLLSTNRGFAAASVVEASRPNAYAVPCRLLVPDLTPTFTTEPSLQPYSAGAFC